jgi:hypothetical protein
MANLAQLGRSDRQLVSELRKEAERIVANVSKANIPEALEQWDIWNRRRIRGAAFGGSHGF